MLTNALGTMKETLRRSFKVKVGFLEKKKSMVLSHVRGNTYILNWKSTIRRHPRFFCEDHTVEGWIVVSREPKSNPVLEFQLIYNTYNMADCWDLNVWGRLPEDQPES
ncbi:hypothetical protein GIB67_025809 [Kingdonia uniflora]|uniref:Uncharacterized protein n=1 Tax=Kingdonia uniflora TaxID=39325 RepID=A0A7J7NSU9_9MAGN|nr:hypothetical protein GIB67_025809 [Kingdonia uniflora]